jgi:hypothetical protein
MTSKALLARQLLSMQESLYELHSKLNLLLAHDSQPRQPAKPPREPRSSSNYQSCHNCMNQPPSKKPTHPRFHPPLSASQLQTLPTRHHLDDSGVRRAIYAEKRGVTPGTARRAKGNWADYGQAYSERERKIRSTWTRPVSATSRIKYYISRDKKIKNKMAEF